MVGQTLTHYRIREQIGAGGMGVVFLAHDEQLERDVAIKLLPPGTLSDEASRRRFRKEAVSLARLNHPNIATIHEFGTEDGTDFLVTEYIAGQTLSDRIATGPLPSTEVIRFGLQLAEGLSAAHQQGIVHRANLRITLDGRLKILDFGLAQFTRPDADVAAHGEPQQLDCIAEHHGNVALHGTRTIVRRTGGPAHRYMGGWRRSL